MVEFRRWEDWEFAREDMLRRDRLDQRCIFDEDHDWEYKEDWTGDPGVINGTYTICWLECSICGEEKAANAEDRPDYSDCYDY